MGDQEKGTTQSQMDVLAIAKCELYRRINIHKRESAMERQQTPWVPKHTTTTPERQLELMQKIQSSIELLNDSEFFKAFLDQIHAPEALHHFQKLTQSEHKVKMVIYGIGSIENAKASRCQLSLAILMKRNLDWIGDMEVYDPIISLTESMVMKQLGFHVLSVNEKGRRQAVEPILFFMPHCDHWLYDNLLKTNWRHDMLNNIVILGNSFEGYHQQRNALNITLNNSKHLLAIRPFTKEFKIRIIEDISQAWAVGLSWHFFSVSGPDTNLHLQLTF